MSYYIVKWSYKRGCPLKTGSTVLVVMCIKKRIYQCELAWQRRSGLLRHASLNEYKCFVFFQNIVLELWPLNSHNYLYPVFYLLINSIIFSRLTADRLMENMNPDMTPYRMLLDVSISPKNKNRKMYNKYKILIKLTTLYWQKCDFLHQ
jgi:hypothetical protein